eukprot:TRINITY_DN89919_c0_g1_i1.p1 TRINITY_DN89919_c0_g1~~TRINITY_DN89919_c0_g1_i1.p1  ORF type:complete len:1177 (-),score=234.31 TRINITY_DN89919_c0_g1_i1:261-3719(-)
MSKEVEVDSSYSTSSSSEGDEEQVRVVSTQSATPKATVAGSQVRPTAVAQSARQRPGAVARTSKVRASSSDSSDASTVSSSSEDESEISDLDGEEEVDKEIEPPVGTPGGFKDLVMNDEPPPLDPSYPGDWAGAPSPGSNGFNRFAARVMWNAKVARPKKESAAKGAADSSRCPPLQPHQEAVAFLLHPQSPVTRLLVDHPTGSGKTREMIRVLDNYFLDSRPKVPIFPKEPVCRNFYLELIRWPSRYRDFFSCLRPQDAALCSGMRDWKLRRTELWDVSELSGPELKDVIVNIRDALEMKGWFYMGKMRRSLREAFQERFPNETVPAAPLRALRYTSAGGRHALLREDGLPVSALLKVAFDRHTAGGNAYSNKVVIMDEVHNLVRVQTQYGEQLARLRTLLSGARGTVLAGFTGTPILNEAQEGRQLLDIIKGLAVSRGDGGFLSSFPMRPAGLFPSSLPRGIPDNILTPNLRRQFVRRVMLTGEPLKRYDAKRQKGLPERRLRSYCNMCVHFGSFHEGRNGNKQRVLEDMPSLAPKLHAIAKDVAENPLKALVLIARSSGMEALMEHLRDLSAAAPEGNRFGVATMDELAEFNAPGNLRGEKYRVIVADAVSCSEGVSFFGVRRVHLAEVPSTPSALVQSVGRAIRMYGHRGLPVDEQTVTTQLWIAGLPSWMRTSLAAWAFRAQRRREEPQEMESGARRLLRRLISAGIKDLETLKARLDACSGVVSNPNDEDKLPLSPGAAATFLEQLGFFEDAKALRLRAQKAAPQMRRRRRSSTMQTQKGKAAGDGHASTLKEENKIKVKPEEPEIKVKDEDEDGEPKVKIEQSSDAEQLRRLPSQVKEELPDQNNTKATQRRVASPQPKASSVSKNNVFLPRRDEPEDDQTLASLVVMAKSKGGPQAQPGAGVSKPDKPLPQELAYWQREPMARALCALHACATAAEAEELLFLSPRSADEEGLRSLAARSREFVPALAELRRKAVDRAVLVAAEKRRSASLQSVNAEDAECSEGQSSELEFHMSDSDGGKKGESNTDPKKPPPVMLPAGWRTESFRRKNREIREFVDPLGRRYRTMTAARKAINAERTRTNMMKQLKSKYASSLSKPAALDNKVATRMPENTQEVSQLPTVKEELMEEAEKSWEPSEAKRVRLG